MGLGELFSQYGAELLASALRITGCDADAEEAVAETFFALLKGNGVLDPSRDPGPYLRRAVVNRSLNQLRRRRRAPLPLPPLLTGPTPAEPGGVDRLRAGIARLSARQAEVFTLRHIEGHDIAEIANALAIAPATVRVHLFQATHALRRRFDAKEARRV
ncbi:MAG: RNA polymerase sigma factor [Planctomycetota bacterium]|jgi:RNA polymerase sigma-70 factor (ECF subfamily)